ncbi:riboflavin synthase subunit alpha [Colwelliaceae bacterium 6441]
MFTGIVQSQAEVYSVKNENCFTHLIVKVAADLIDGLTLGASIAINGVCLTVVRFERLKSEAHIAFDIIDETLERSNLANLRVGNLVNLERSLKMGDELGGHIVSGHVHTKALLLECHLTKSNCAMRFAIDNKWQKYILPKGFITINGISLTVGEVTKNNFYVHLIPETLARTNLSELTVNDAVNVELDQQTITIVTTLERMNLPIK